MTEKDQPDLPFGKAEETTLVPDEAEIPAHLLLKSKAKEMYACGWSIKEIAAAFPRLIAVESGIGYEKTFARWRVFESYAWMHFHYGREGRALNPSWYDAVIPNYLDPKDYPFNPKTPKT